MLAAVVSALHVRAVRLGLAGIGSRARADLTIPFAAAAMARRMLG